MEKIRVNLKTQVINNSIRREKRNGRDVIVVPSATLPDNVVMNGILYPADEIEKSYQTLDRTHAPLGHPFINNQYVPAGDPEAINGFGVGAWNENVRRTNGRVFLDKVIDVEVANTTVRGKALLDAIDQQKPIHTSTGLLLDLEPAAAGMVHEYVGRNMEFDHDAILIGEDGAATPAQGVGIFVNAKGEREEVATQNAEIELDEESIRDIADTLAWRIEHEAREEQRKPLVEALTAKIRALLDGLKIEGAPIMAANSKSNEGHDMSDEKLKELETKLDNLTSNALNAEGVKAVIEEAVKPLIETVTEIKANAKAKEDAEKAELVDKVVKANLFSEDEAKELSVNHLRKLAEKVKPGTAEGIFGGFNKADPDALSDELPGGDE